MFALAYGLGLGVIAGASVGPHLFRGIKPTSYDFLDHTADHMEEMAAPEPHTIVPHAMRKLLEHTEAWTMSPDFQRVATINHVLKVLWPSLTQSILDSVLTNPAIGEQLHSKVFQKYKFVEDIVVGNHSLKSGKASELTALLAGKNFSVGPLPPRLGGLKIYSCQEDEVILEVPLLWGSSCTLHICAVLKLGPIRVFVPLEVANLHLKATARITIRPLVESIPCVGGATISLLGVPTLDCSLKVFHGCDLMALPGVPQALRFGLQKVLSNIVVYPNSVSVKVMPNFGVPSPPKGAIRVLLQRAEGFKGGDDTFVRLEVRSGRPVQSTMQKNQLKPQWDEEFHLIVDDFEQQSLKVELMNSAQELGFDSVLGVGELTFAKLDGIIEQADGTAIDAFTLADFIKDPSRPALVCVPLFPPDKRTATQAILHNSSRVLSLATSTLRLTKHRTAEEEAKARAVDPRGQVFLKLSFIPFLQPTYDDELEEAAETAARRKKSRAMMPGPAARTVNMTFQDAMKGVLTVTLVRCTSLAVADGNAPNTYVTLLLEDSDRDKDEMQRSSVLVNEDSPRWGSKFDFVMVNASSVLHVGVYNRHNLLSLAGITSNITGVFKRKHKDDHDECLGRLTLPVRDVVRNGRLKDVFQLEDTERGNIELVLNWQTCHMLSE